MEPFLISNTPLLKKHVIVLLLTFFSFKGFSQCNLLCNTNFDDAQVMTPASPTFVNASSVPCWKTTAPDNMIEIWNSGYENVNAYSGSQFVELNANTPSTLYQDFIAVSGRSLTVSFAHRGRLGTDVMSVEIGPAGGPYTPLGTYSDGQSAWGYYTVGFTIPGPPGTYNYSLRFTSISSAGNNPSIGNFLDAISITMDSYASLALNSLAVSCLGSSDGSAIATVTDGATPYSYTWSPSGANTATVSGLTAGLYSVNIRQADGCLLSGSVNVVPGWSGAAAVSGIITCASPSVTLLSIASGSNVNYTWTGPDNYTTIGQNVLTSIPGTYSLTISEGTITCNNTSIVTVNSNTLVPDINSGLTQTLSCSGFITLDAGSSTPGVEYTWIGPGGFRTIGVLNPTVNVIGDYTLTVIAPGNGCINSSVTSIVEGCVDTTDVTIPVVSELEIPNVFTPNGDNVNEAFTIRTVGIKEMNVYIFNRWGEKLYDYDGINPLWNGTTLQGNEVTSGVYFYLVKATDVNNKVIEKCGTVDVFR